MAVIASSSLPALSAEPPVAGPGYVQDANGKVVMSGSGACWHTSDWTPAKSVVLGCDGVLAKAVPIPPPPATAAAEPAAPPVTEQPPLAQAGRDRLTSQGAEAGSNGRGRARRCNRQSGIQRKFVPAQGRGR
jgi:hypothetical protein